MASLVHTLWRKVPHRARRALFASASLALGTAAVRSATAGSRGPVTVVGSFGAPTGLGEAARLLLAGFMATGREVHAIDVTRPLKQSETVDVTSLPPPPSVGPGAIVIVQNPPVSAYLLHLLGHRLLAGKRIIGHWVWEYGTMPSGWSMHARLFHAIAAPSRFCCDTFMRGLDRPVVLAPYPAALDPRWGAVPEQRPDGQFRIGFVGDMVAAAGRKNPLACVKAVARAFPADPSIELVLALGGADPGHPICQALAHEAHSHGVYLTVDSRYLSPHEHRQRLAGFDAFLSLHRAEGFGLGIAEAMLLGTPVVATGAPPMDELLGVEGWSVPWNNERAPPTIEDPAPGDWAAPDVDAAAAALRAIRADVPASARRAAAGRARLVRELGPESFGLAAAVLLGGLDHGDDQNDCGNDCQGNEFRLTGGGIL
jgi:glycosyltransferase involved in cell wall biosynthesis